MLLFLFVSRSIAGLRLICLSGDDEVDMRLDCVEVDVQLITTLFLQVMQKKP